MCLKRWIARNASRARESQKLKSVKNLSQFVVVCPSNQCYNVALLQLRAMMTWSSQVWRTGKGGEWWFDPKIKFGSVHANCDKFTQLDFVCICHRVEQGYERSHRWRDDEKNAEVAVAVIWNQTLPLWLWSQTEGTRLKPNRRRSTDRSRLMCWWVSIVPIVGFLVGRFIFESYNSF